MEQQDYRVPKNNIRGKRGESGEIRGRIEEEGYRKLNEESPGAMRGTVRIDGGEGKGLPR